MTRLAAVILGIHLLAVPLFACQECIIYEVSVGMGRAVSVKGEAVAGAKVRLRKAIRRSGDRPHALSCLYSFDKGPKVKSTKTDSQGRFTFQDMAPGTYWLAIRGKNAQVVRVIEVVRNSRSVEQPAEFQTSETGFTGNQCDVLLAKDFM